MRSAKVIKDLRIRTAWFTCRHVGRDARSAPPIFLYVVIKNTTALHADVVSIFFAANFYFLGLNTLFLKKFFPNTGGLGILWNIICCITTKNSYKKLLWINTNNISYKFKKPW